MNNDGRWPLSDSLTGADDSIARTLTKISTCELFIITTAQKTNITSVEFSLSLISLSVHAIRINIVPALLDGNNILSNQITGWLARCDCDQLPGDLRTWPYHFAVS